MCIHFFLVFPFFLVLRDSILTCLSTMYHKVTDAQQSSSECQRITKLFCKSNTTLSAKLHQSRYIYFFYYSLLCLNMLFILSIVVMEYYIICWIIQMFVIDHHFQAISGLHSNFMNPAAFTLEHHSKPDICTVCKHNQCLDASQSIWDCELPPLQFKSWDLTSVLENGELVSVNCRKPQIYRTFSFESFLLIMLQISEQQKCTSRQKRSHYQRL